MHLPLTFAALATLTGALVLLRFSWPHLSPRLQIFFIASACIILLLFGLAMATRWSISSLRVNTACYWACIASYIFFLVLFTRLRPYWLTSIIAIILILPILSSSFLLPLTVLFDTLPVTKATLGNHFISERVPWSTHALETAGTDLTIYSGPPWASFIRRRRQAARYYNSQCNASQAFAVLQPDGKSVLMVCPAAPGQPPDTARRLVVKLY